MQSKFSMTLLMLLLLFGFIQISCASETAIFYPAKSDISIEYLGKIFGNISPSLSNVTNPDTNDDLPGIHGDMHLLGNLFALFNKITLFIGILIIIYIIIVGTIQSAATGKLLGERWSGAFLPLRSVLGIILLIPNITGYCLAQVLVMSLVYYGVGAADTMWSTTLKYIETGHSIYADVNRNAKRDNFLQYQQNIMPVKMMLSQLYQLVACDVSYANSINGLPDSMVNRAKEFNDKLPPLKIFKAQTGVQFDNDNDVNYLYFGILNTSILAQRKYCGEVDLTSIQDKAIRKQIASAIKTTADTLLSMVPEKDSNKEWSAPPLADTKLLNAIIDYISAEMIKENKKDIKTDEIENKIKDYGWILAGNYYRWLSRQNADLNKQETYAKSIFVSSCGEKEQKSCDLAKNQFELIYDTLAQLPSQDLNKDGQIKKDDAWDYFNKNNLANGVDIARNLTGKQKKEHLAVMFATLGVGAAFDELMKPIIKGISGQFDSPGDPFSSAVDMGTQMMSIAAIIATFSLLVGNMIFGLVAYVCSGENSAGVGAQTVQSVIASMVLGVAGFLYTQGVMLAIYLPLIPFVIFIFGVLGWFITVIEAMIAAPLVAIGLMWPDGQNEIWGRSEAALFMLLNLFLRPALMIIGLICGILLCWVGFKLAQIGFRFMLSQQYIGVEPTFGWLAVGFVYAMLLISIAKRAFSLIHHIPDSVLKWIGDNSPGLGGADEFTQSLQGGTEKGGGAVSGMHGQIGSYKGWKGSDMFGVKGFDNPKDNRVLGQSSAVGNMRNAGKAAAAIFKSKPNDGVSK